MATLTQVSNIDSVMTYILIKKLVSPITRSQAYRLKLVDNAGKVVKTPETEQEKAALTVLDRFIFKLKRLLGSKLTVLNNFLYTITLGNDFYNNLIVKGGVETRGEIKRINKDVKNVMEKYNISFDTFLMGILNENITEGDVQNETI
jgi:hypothetical protein